MSALPVPDLSPQRAYMEVLWEARRIGYRLSDDAQRRLLAAFRDAARRIEYDLSRATTAISAERAAQMRAEVWDIIKGLEQEVASTTARSAGLTARDVATLHEESVRDILRTELGRVPRLVTTNFNRVQAKAAAVLASSDRVSTFRTLVRRNVREAAPALDTLITSAVARGVTPKQLSRDIADLLATAEGADLSTYGLDDHAVTGLRTLYADSNRIAVTETLNALRGANRDSTVASTIVAAVKWQLSGVHENLEEDECDLLADADLYGYGPGYYPPEVFPEAPHPWCFLPGTRVSGLFTAAMRAKYQGKVVQLETARGYRLTVTPHHPVLTPTGFRPAYLLREGEDVLSHPVGADVLPTPRHLHPYDPPATVEQVFSTLQKTSRVATREGAAEYFHGDGVGVQGNIEIVWPDGLLLAHGHMQATERLCELILMRPTEQEAVVRCLSAAHLLMEGDYATARCPMGGPDEAKRIAAAFTVVPPERTASFGPSAQLNLRVPEPSGDGGTTDAQFARQMLHGFAADVATDKIVRVHVYDFAGHIYDLSTEQGWLLAGNIYVSNCACTEGGPTIFRPVEEWGTERGEPPEPTGEIPGMPVDWSEARRERAFKALEQATGVTGLKEQEILVSVEREAVLGVPSPTPPPPAGIIPQMEAWEQQHVSDPIEHAYAVGPDGTVILEKVGSEDSVHFTIEECNSLSGATFSHNHPSGVGFSAEDLRFATANNLVEIRASGVWGDGTQATYRWNPANWSDPNVVPMGSQQVGARYREAVRDLMPKYEKWALGEVPLPPEWQAQLDAEIMNMAGPGATEITLTEKELSRLRETLVFRHHLHEALEGLAPKVGARYERILTSAASRAGAAPAAETAAAGAGTAKVAEAAGLYGTEFADPYAASRVKFGIAPETAWKEVGSTADQAHLKHIIRSELGGPKGGAARDYPQITGSWSPPLSHAKEVASEEALVSKYGKKNVLPIGAGQSIRNRAILDWNDSSQSAGANYLKSVVRTDENPITYTGEDGFIDHNRALESNALLDADKWLDVKLSHTYFSDPSGKPLVFKDSKAIARDMVWANEEATQALLRGALGDQPITLYRGVLSDALEANGYEARVGVTGKLDISALSSWSRNPVRARSFGDVLLRAEVPIDQIHAVYLTEPAFGAKEAEVIIKGPTVRFQVIGKMNYTYSKSGVPGKYLYAPGVTEDLFK